MSLSTGSKQPLVRNMSYFIIFCLINNNRNTSIFLLNYYLSLQKPCKTFGATLLTKFYKDIISENGWLERDDPQYCQALEY